MENTRAIYLIENSQLSEKDKYFLLTHIETYSDANKSLEVEIMTLKDIIEYNMFLHDKILRLKENIIRLAGEEEVKISTLKKLEKLLEDLKV